jgi:dipeptidyl aminopeptidase/acylaminoacyl peptidase
MDSARRTRRPVLTFASSLLPLVLACTACTDVVSAQAKPQSPTATLLAELGQTKRIGDVALSPDGHKLAMEVDGGLRLVTLGANGSVSGSSPKAGQPVTVCTSGEAGITSLSWSPDNTRLAILAHCGDALQIVVTTAQAGAAPRVLATVHGFAKSLEYAPDGKSLALLYVEGATRPSGALAAMKPPSGVIGVEGLEVQRVALVNTETGQLSQVTPAGLHVYEFSFSPDSQKLAYVAAAPPGENNWWIAKLYTQAVTPGSEPKVILDPGTVAGPLHGLQIAVPRWSPRGTEIALIGGLMSDQGATGGDLYVLPSDGSGGPTDLTTNFNSTLEWLQFLPNGKLLTTQTVGGLQQIVELSLTFSPDFKAPRGTHVLTVNEMHMQTLQKPSVSIGDGRLAGSFAVSADGTVAAWDGSNYSSAPEIYAGPLTTGADPLPAITSVNANLKPSWGKAESIDWTNDGFHVQGWLLYPANYDPAKHYGLIVMVHGGPSSAVTPRWPYAGFGAAPLAASGYFVLEPNPRGSYGQGEAFTQANRKDFGYGDLRDVLAGVDAVEKEIPAIDDHRLGLTGWSYGGFMTMFGVTQTHRFRAAVAGAGISDWLSYYGENSIDQWMTPFFGASVYKEPAVYAKSSAINFMDKVTTPTLVVVGDRDGECPAPQSFEFWHALKAFDVPTTLVVYPDEGHGFVNPDHRRDVLERSIAWFNKYLPQE